MIYPYNYRPRAGFFCLQFSDDTHRLRLYFWLAILKRGVHA
ncbi:Uncharacterised protein [Yersinia enterocolitica]|nr:Uncharacterised protein [Yersinia enterocolitica]